ncbi:LysR family transcriptional regulator [Kocuria dechangensis]|uniref:LysR family transcriptional regulator n=1 Tax=Kocuria dechangensis TaxID=1176249 RepID=A0A917H364_9MICC|nr:LysR substrate-binding domain-containing protein [Kocuria dechangensis]GGG65987.1 LysR family transcriptional regulator [Kocuria dechangensis]
MAAERDLDISFGVTIRQIQIFVVTAESGSITIAAERLYLSQTAVSLALSQLEKTLGATLMVRRRAHGITLTSTGRSLLPMGRNILANVAEFQEEAQDATETTGTVTIGCFPSLGPGLLPGLIEKFQEDHPSARLNFIEAAHEDLMTMVETGTLDLVMAYDIGLPAGLQEMLIDTCIPGVLLSAKHPLAVSGKAVSIQELVDEPFILLDSPTSAEHARMIFHNTGVRPEVKFRSQNFETVRSLAGRGLGWSITLQRPQTDISHEGAAVRILDLKDEEIRPVRVVAVWSPELTLGRATKAFLKTLQQETSSRTHREN